MGKEAQRLFDDANALLDKIVDQDWLKARACIGLFAANAIDDDIEVYSDDKRDKVIANFHMLRQQNTKAATKANLSLADFIAPKSSGLADYIGFFAVTAGIGIDKGLDKFKIENDTYNDIMLKAMADRLAEAFAELMHARIRREFWGYNSDEKLCNDQLIAEKYRGIRPAPGYPACPDHTEKRTLFDLLES